MIKDWIVPEILALLFMLSGCTETSPPNKHLYPTSDATTLSEIADAAPPLEEDTDGKADKQEVTPDLSAPDASLSVPKLTPRSSEPILTAETFGEWAVLNYLVAVLVHDGIFYMFYSGVSEAGAGMGYAISPDGYSWEVETVEAPLFTEGIFGDDPVQFSSGDILIMDDGTWVMYLSTFVQGANEIRRLTAPAPTGPWTAEDEPVLVRGEPDAWDGQTGVFAPDVLRTNDGYVMYYQGSYRFNLGMIGLATSPDNVTWTKYNDPATTEARFIENDPVLYHPSETGEEVADYWFQYPAVWRTSIGWHMLYVIEPNGIIGSEASFGYASSQDGIEWQPYDDDLLLELGTEPIISTALAHHENAYFLYFTLVEENEASNMYMVTFEPRVR
jgi:hypothetical protein